VTFRDAGHRRDLSTGGMEHSIVIPRQMVVTFNYCVIRSSQLVEESVIERVPTSNRINIPVEGGKPR